MKVLFVCLCLAATLGACEDPEAVTTNEITMTDSHSFDPEVTAADAGSEITFVNDDDEPHTVTAYEESLPEGAEYFSSGDFITEDEAREGVGEALIAPGEEYTITLEQPGTYKYFCIPHEGHGMKGEIQI